MSEYLTKEKYDELIKELDYLQTKNRKEIAEQLEHAKSLGDLSENAEYHEARDSQAIVEDRIKKLDLIIKSAVIISSHSTDIVAVGSTIIVSKSGGGEKEYTIVGSEESDFASGKISINSPFGREALGKKVGQTFSYEAPSGTVSYKIIKIK